MTKYVPNNRINFLKKMIDSVFVIHTICYSNTIPKDESSPIEEIVYGEKDLISNCKACQFSPKMMDYVSEIFIPIFKYDNENIKVSFSCKKSNKRKITFYQKRAKKYIQSLITDDITMSDIVNELPLSTLSDIFEMIIDELFSGPFTNSENPAEDSFENNQHKICNKIKNILSLEKERDSESTIREYDHSYCYICEELKQYDADIEQYKKTQDIKYLDLNRNNNINEFHPKVIYRYDTICTMDFFPDIEPCDYIHLFFIYNGEKIVFDISANSWNFIESKIHFDTPDTFTSPMTIFFILDNNTFRPLLLT